MEPASEAPEVVLRLAQLGVQLRQAGVHLAGFHRLSKIAIWLAQRTGCTIRQGTHSEPPDCYSLVYIPFFECEMIVIIHQKKKLDDGWPESEKDVFQAALTMVVVKDSRWMVGEFLYELWRDKVWKVRLIKKRILGKGHQMTRVLQPQRDIDIDR